MGHDVMSVSLYGGEAQHSLCRANCHRDPARPVLVEWSPWFVIQVSALAFVVFLDAVLLLSF